MQKKLDSIISKRRKIITLLAAFTFVALASQIAPIPGLENSNFFESLFYEPDIYAGTIEAKRLVIDSQINGRISRILVEEGTSLTKGQILLEIDDESHRLQVNKANTAYNIALEKLGKMRKGARIEEIEALKAEMLAANDRYENLLAGSPREELDKAASAVREQEQVVDYHKQNLARIRILESRHIESRSTLDLAETNFNQHSERLKILRKNLELLKNGANALQRDAMKQEYVSARNKYEGLANGERAEDLKLAELDAESSRIDIKRSELDLKNTRILSPTDCAVEAVMVDAGSVIDQGAHLISLLLVDDLYVDVYVPSSRILNIHIGQTAKSILVSAGKEYKVTGRVSFIAASGEYTPQNIYTREQHDLIVYKVRVFLDKNTGLDLKPGIYLDNLTFGKEV